MMSLELLYKMTLPPSVDKKSLYIQGNYKQVKEGIAICKGEIADFGTYFNLFSVKKWCEYTSIERLQVKLELTGTFKVEYYGMNNEGEALLLTSDGSTEFDVNQIKNYDCLGIRFVALSDGIFHSGEYLGLFSSVQEVKIGVTICTFKREEYLLPNLDKLQQLTESNGNINVMVIDNGRTLAEKNLPNLQIIHNPNYGGSGGFTRGLIEQVNQHRNTHVILMDDDVAIELSAFDRLYALLRHLKSEHKCKFFAGAMLNLDTPSIQTENTAYWNKFISIPFGKNFNLANKKTLCRNEYANKHKNQYAGWWFCCIPLDVVQKIGYPLPNFIKGDDIEYGIRNQQDVMSMNGVGVWHEPFAKKLNTTMKYFSDRSMLLVNHFAADCGRCTFAFAVILRIIKRTLKGDFDGIRIFEPAIKDLNGGLSTITSTRADEKFAEIKSYSLNKNILHVLFSIIKETIYHIKNYRSLNKNFLRFRAENLSNQTFWLNYLNLF